MRITRCGKLQAAWLATGSGSVEYDVIVICRSAAFDRLRRPRCHVNGDDSSSDGPRQRAAAVDAAAGSSRVSPKLSTVAASSHLHQPGGRLLSRNLLRARSQHRVCRAAATGPATEDDSASMNFYPPIPAYRSKTPFGFELLSHFYSYSRRDTLANAITFNKIAGSQSRHQ